jgi:hypothetical protein
MEAAHSHAALDDGFHPNEETHRWTAGVGADTRGLAALLCRRIHC